MDMIVVEKQVWTDAGSSARDPRAICVGTASPNRQDHRSTRRQNVTFALPHDRVYVLETRNIVWEGDPARFAGEMSTGYLW